MSRRMTRSFHRTDCCRCRDNDGLDLQQCTFFGQAQSARVSSLRTKLRICVHFLGHGFEQLAGDFATAVIFVDPVAIGWLRSANLPLFQGTRAG